jgi:hypothetical protein
MLVLLECCYKEKGSLIDRYETSVFKMKTDFFPLAT